MALNNSCPQIMQIKQMKPKDLSHSLSIFVDLCVSWSYLLSSPNLRDPWTLTGLGPN
jgi:hypothetical protein